MEIKGVIEKIWCWLNKCTCQKCGHTWKSFKIPAKCPECFSINWMYAKGGPVMSGLKKDGRKGPKPGDFLFRIDPKKGRN